MPKDEVIPPLAAGDALSVKKVDLLEKKTEPPRRYGQGKLIETMEKLGLGTKATRHEALSKLYNRGYIEGNPPKPTQTGITLIDALKAHAGAITSPAMTARLESDMDGIAESRLRKDQVTGESKAMLRTIFDQLESHRADIGRTLRAGSAMDSPSRAVPEVREPPRNKGDEAEKRKFIACTGFPECRNTYNVPPGTLKFDKKTCEKHKLHLVKVAPPSIIDSQGKR